jgi:LuxR family maltose regulon positive regulatory protein
LLAAFETAVPQPNANLTLPPVSLEHTSIDSLSKRELEIMTLIAGGFKSKEIAEQLVISLNTVLYHNKNIYSKLGVNKRTLAIAKAKELNLIES